MRNGLGPLAGVRVLDFSALGPGPFASMMLADFGADVVSVQRPGMVTQGLSAWLGRGKTFVELDLRHPDDRATAVQLANGADVVVEGFRPGTMERLGLGPDDLMKDNGRLVYARLTGWGQYGPYARRAGHDVNFLAVSGVLSVCGGEAPAMPPPALLGDLSSGSLYMVCGILAALFERDRTGNGAVIDAAIVDGAAYLLTALLGEKESGMWSGRREEHILSGNAPFYTLYRCRDGKWFSVGAIEPKFYDGFLSVLGFDDVSRDISQQMDQSAWPALKARVAARFAEQDRSDWVRLFAEADACGAPLLELDELGSDPHLAERGTAVPEGKGFAVSPAPRLEHVSREQGAPRQFTAPADRLQRFGLSDALISKLSFADQVEAPNQT